MTAAPDIAIRITGNIKVFVPASINSLTTYVLLEQEDWFEAELPFLREYMQPGMRMIDIGANYGVYALTMASGVGSSGQVFAFEPSTTTAAFLSKSTTENQFCQLAVIVAALSNFVGTAILSSDAPEFKSLRARDGETVRTTTLDAWSAESACGAIDFVKIDAEGEEANIISGGRNFFSAQNPLVMLEILHGDIIEFAGTQELKQLGYEVYRLVPGLCTLAPIQTRNDATGTASLDPYQLNLFCCKPASAKLLETRGLLTTEAIPSCDIPPVNSWLPFLRRQPSFAPLEAVATNFLAGNAIPGADQYRSALDHYAMSQDRELARGARYAHLISARGALEGALAQATTIARFCTASRLLADSGLRGRAVEVLRNLLNALSKPVNVNEPFICPSQRFDAVLPDSGKMGMWLTASILDALQRLASFSSAYLYTTGVLNQLEFLKQTGFQLPEMERRRQLIRIRLGLQKQPEPSALLAVSRATNLNPELWDPERRQIWAERY